MPSHRAFKSTTSCSFGLILKPLLSIENSPFPSTCPLPPPPPPAPITSPLPPLPPQLTPSLSASGIENNQQEPGSCRTLKQTNKLLLNQSKTLHAGRLPSNRSEGSVLFVIEMTRSDSNLCLLQPPLPEVTRLVESVAGGSDRLHLVVVTRSPFLSLSLSDSLLISFSFTSPYPWTGCFVF